jgi:hypothetical protein
VEDGIAEDLAVERESGSLLTGLEAQIDRLVGSRIPAAHRIPGPKAAAEGGDEMRRRRRIEDVDVDPLADQGEQNREGLVEGHRRIVA